MSFTVLFIVFLFQCLVTTSLGSQTGDILLRGGTIITFDEATAALKPILGSILISNGTIKTISSSINVTSDVEVIDAKDTIISPGFVDTHRHGWQTVYRTLAPNITLAAYYWSLGEFGVARFIFDPEDVYISQLVGIYEALNAGVTSIVDHAHHTWTPQTAEAGLNASIDSGARVWWCYTIHPVPNSTMPYVIDNSATTWQLEQMVNMSKRGEMADGRVHLGLAYDGLTGPQSTVTDIFNAATQNNITPITTHYVGGVFQPNLEAIQVLQTYNLLNISTPIIFSHASGITDAEITLLRQSNQYVSITPESELHYGHGNPKSHKLTDQAALGIDTHMTFSTDIITQMRIWLQTIRGRLYQPVVDDSLLPNNTGMTTDQIFLMGTRNGGLALRRPDIGVIREGAKADLVVFNATGFSMLGWSDPVAAIVLHSNVGDIRDVVVDGRVVKRDGRLVDPLVERAKEKFLKRTKVLQERFAGTNWTDFRLGLWREVSGWTGDEFEEVDKEDVVRGPLTGYYGVQVGGW
ncbi:MAG: hypothetical protein M1834_008406 [Cirrosporium novae-zelandiae]|nr:MAG: hypothetical protein M1834_008406 [Cirrosporium novae-zelandiae]